MAGFDFDGKAFGVEIVSVVKDYLERNLSPVIVRLDALEKRLAEQPAPKNGVDGKDGQAGKDGADADPEIVAELARQKIAGELAELRATVEAIPPAPELPDVAAMIERAVNALPTEETVAAMIEKRVSELPEPPALPEPPDVGAMIENAMLPYEKAVEALIEKHIAELPPLPELPELPDVEGMIKAAIETVPTVDEAAIRTMIEAQIAELPKPQDGKSVTVEDVTPLIDEKVAKAVAAIPVPKDGAPGKDGIDGKEGAPGKDGVGFAGAIIDRSGHLNMTLTDGQTRDLGPVVGKDGKDGEPGKDGAPGEDGLGFEEMDEILDEDGRTIIRRYSRDGRIKEYRHTFGVVLDKGVFKDGTEYQRGDGVSYGGSFWIAQGTTTDKPDDKTETGRKSWRLAVKRGRDGKDGIVKAEKKVEPIKVGVPSKDGGDDD
jgi:hypothetical protein